MFLLSCLKNPWWNNHRRNDDMLDFSIEREHSMKYQELGGSKKWGENQSSFKIDSNPETNSYHKQLYPKRIGLKIGCMRTAQGI